MANNIDAMPLPPIAGCPSGCNPSHQSPNYITPLVSVSSVNGETGDVVLKSLTIGDKIYNGSDDIEITSADLDLNKAFKYRKTITTKEKVLDLLSDAEVGDVFFCSEDHLFYLSTGEGEYKTFVSESALAGYAKSSEVGTILELNIEETTRVLTAKLLDKNETVISESTVTLPAESLIKSAEYDSTKKALVITFQNGTTVEIPLGDLVDGLVTQDTFDTAIAQINAQFESMASQINAALATKQDIISDIDTIREKAATALQADALTPYRTSIDQDSIDTQIKESITSEIESRTVAEAQLQTNIDAKQDKITEENKLDYNLLKNTPEIPVVTDMATKTWVTEQGYLTEHQDISGLATKEEVATVEAKIPTVPTNVSAFTNDAGYLTEHQDISNLATRQEVTAVEAKIPTKVSELTNDAGYLTEHQSLANYSTTEQMNIAIGNYHDASKQDNLTAGTNISIIDNVISSTASGALTKTLTTNVSVGNISAGETFEIGTSFETILRRMLTSSKILSGITISQAPTKVEYEAGETFEPAGMEITAQFNTGSEVVTDYIYSPNRALTAADNAITISYTYEDITKTAIQAITVSEATTKIYLGGTGSGTEQIDPTAADFSKLVETEVQNPETNLVGSHIWTIVAGTDEDKQFATIAVTNKYKVTKVDSDDGAFSYDFIEVPGVTGYNMYYIVSEKSDYPDGTKYLITIQEV